MIIEFGCSVFVRGSPKEDQVLVGRRRRMVAVGAVTN